MIEIIEHGDLYKTVRCSRCGCKFRYHVIEDTRCKHKFKVNMYGGIRETNDVDYEFVECPECSHECKIDSIAKQKCT